MKKQHLKFCCLGSPANGHPQKLMHDLGITYQHATPQPMGEQWWFWNCENAPDPLPSYLSTLKITPIEAVGRGLSKEDAESIIAGNSIIQNRNE